MNDITTLSGRRGTFRIANTTLYNSDNLPANNKKFATIVIEEDETQIAVLTENGLTASAAALARHGVGTSDLLNKGEVIVAETYFESIQLSAGVVSIS